MATACFIPVKTRSIRVPGKNFRELNGKRLFEYAIDSAIEYSSFEEIYVDTDSADVSDYSISRNCKVLQRDPGLALDTANGNDLINSWYSLFPEYDEYFQLFVTSPFNSPQTIKACVDILRETDEYDSILTAHEECGWYWFERTPVNYDPKTLPRSQDAKKVFSETTALYGIKNEALRSAKSRIGNFPYFYFVDDIEAVDIDSEFDFRYAEMLAANLQS